MRMSRIGLAEIFIDVWAGRPNQQCARLPNRLVGPTSNLQDSRLGWVAQPAIRKIADWAGWLNQQFPRLPTGLGGPTSNAHDCRMGYVAQPAIRNIADWVR